MENNYFPLLSHAHFSPSDVFHKALVNLSSSNNGIVIFLIPVRVWEYLEWANSVKSPHCTHSFPFGQIGFLSQTGCHLVTVSTYLNPNQLLGMFSWGKTIFVPIDTCACLRGPGTGQLVQNRQLSKISQ